MSKRLVTVVAAATLALLGLASPALAHHNTPDLTVDESGDCGETTLTTAWITETHTVANARLVVQAGDTQKTAQIGDSITVGPFEADTVIRYRVWGGGERDYDQPPLSDLAALVEYLNADADNSPLDADAPGVAWHEKEVKGCPPPKLVEPKAPWVKESKECEAADTIRLPYKQGVSYSISGEYTKGDTGDFTVIATANEGYELQGTTEWKFTIGEPEKCPTTPPTTEPTQEPTTPPTATPTETPTATPTETPTGTPTSAAEKNGDELPKTTGPAVVITLGGLAVLLLAVGGGLMIAARRRTQGEML